MMRLTRGLCGGLLLALLTSGCGSGDLKPSGGTLTVLAAADVSSLDPGQVQGASQVDYMVMAATQRTLYRWAPGSPPRLAPDLADGPPGVSSDGLSLTVHLRTGVRFGPPVGREVTAADVRYAIERAFSAHVASSGVRAWLGDLEGAPPKPGPVTAIAGLQTPDPHTLVMRLRRPTAGNAASSLVLHFTSPVPVEYAQRFDRGPGLSAYGEHVIATGPYMVRNDRGGRIVGRQPGRSIELVRNPDWSRKTDTRPAHLERIVFREGNQDGAIASRRILAGSHMINGDILTPPPALKEALSRYRHQIVDMPIPATTIIALNTRIQPLDDPDVRRAILAATDRVGLLLSVGGQYLGDIPSHLIPPGLPGFAEAGGAKGTGDDFLRSPEGDVALARRYLHRARCDGGSCARGRRLLAIFDTRETPGAEALQQQLDRIGIHIQIRIVAVDTAQTRFCGVPASHTALCATGVGSTTGDPASVLNPSFDGRAIQPQGNPNPTQLEDPAVDAAIDRAVALPPGPDRNRAWGDVDRLVTADAPMIPVAWDKFPLVESADVTGVPNSQQYAWDLSYTALRGAIRKGGK